ncbi:glycosyltransferase [Aeromicrobium wangtongii]|uniref:Glycosyltransferase n=1 Tax=Aeromicrobium wangtongii TaxID=2969247 RepID=A0ABY5MAX8_9ACTN|nr:glycosyltransferase [Aeromicrobium wangtongii]MCD9196786.1 glycosyltransferase [Aeromicrobium wangtongii]UUP14296.1 glycosyltransferase [Aeromicrobium wangtongii]
MSPSPADRLRSVAKRAREAARTDGTPADSDARTLLASGLFDPWYYGLQTRTEMTPSEAAEHYLSDGAASGLLPNPLTDVDATGLAPDDVVAALLGGAARTFPVRPILDDLELVALAPAATEHPGGPVGFYLEHARAGAPVPALGQRSWKRFVRLRQQQSAALETILAAAVLDRPYYEAQTRRTFLSDRQAVWHFLETGESAALSLSPLYERAWYRSKAGVRTPMTFMHLLRTGQTAGAAGPHFDGATHLQSAPEAADHPGGPLGHFLSQADDATLTVPDPDSGIVPVPWGAFREHLLAAATETGRQEALLRPRPTSTARWTLAAAEPAEGSSERVTIVADARTWGRDVPERLATVLAQRYQTWTMRVAVDEGAPIPPSLAELDDLRIVLVPTRAESWAGRAQDVLATADEPWTIFWQPQETWSPALLGALLSAAAPDTLVHAAVVDEETGRWWTDLADHDALVWDEPRSLAAMLVPTERLRADALRSQAEDRFGWDFLLRHDLTPRFVPFIGLRAADPGSLPTSAGRRSTYAQVVRSAAAADWDTITRGSGTRVVGRASVLVVATGDRHRTRRAVDSVLEGTAGDVEVVLVDNGSHREVSAILTACYAGDPRVHVHRLPSTSHTPVAVNRAVAASTGEVVVLLDHDNQVDPGWLEPLVEALRDPDVLAAQPLLLTADDTIRSAGVVGVGRHLVPVHLLASHPVEDLPAGDIAPDAVSGVCLAVRADALASVGGLDPVFSDLADVDLCLRLADSRTGRFATVARSRVSRRARQAIPPPAEADQLQLLERWGGRLPEPRIEHWQRAGFEVAGFRAGPGLPASRRRTTVTPELTRTPRLVAEGPGAGLPSLRWAIKIAAQGGPRGDEWGDTYFAADLVRGLRAWGQEAFVDRRGAHERPGVDGLDDVTVTLRGRWPAVTQPGATNVLWVISHPDEVPLEELGQGFDLIYSAGAGWAEQVRAATSLDVRTLLQATDASRFTTHGEAMAGLGTLFVGRTRKVMRPVVGDALAAGADLTVFGDGWESFIDPAHVAADHLPNEQVPAAYRGARIVLNDHWSDMARLGFYSNRLFDAVASGARVVTDPVEGVEELLGPSVRSYRTLDELRDLLDPSGSAWPDPDVVAANAARVAAEHSFVARAKVLLADVLNARGVEHVLDER